VQTGQQPGGDQHVRVILAVRRGGHLQRLFQHQPSASEITAIAQDAGILVYGGEVSGLRHVRHAAWRCGAAPAQPLPDDSGWPTHRPSGR
jgi:hypothetical protein